MKLLFAGTPDFAIPSLNLLADAFDVVAVLTAPDRRRGRGRQFEASPVARAAEVLNIPVIRPERLNREARGTIVPFRADLLVVVAYGRIFGPKFLSLFPEGGINLHPSLLPAYRGPAPIPAAILSGDDETGITVQRVALEMDAGAILDQSAVPLDGSETAVSLSERFSHLGAERLVGTVRGIAAGAAGERPQDESKVTCCKIIEKTDGAIDWSDSAIHIDRMVRAYTPWPTAHTTYDGKFLSILGAGVREDDGPGRSPGEVVGVDKASGILIQTGSGILVVERLQLQSKKPLSFRDFLNGSPRFTDTILGDSAAGDAT